MTNHLLKYLCIGLACLVSCSKQADDQEDPLGDGIPFTTGTIEMGMYSQGVDLGYFIERLDFSRDDVQEQFMELAENTEEGRKFVELLQAYSESNPFAALGLVMNAVSCTYYVKDDAVLGKARGFGYEFDNYHDAQHDEGKIYTRTFVQATEIPTADRELSVSYVPSADLGVGSGGAIEASRYDRQVAIQKENVNGYSCQVSTYTIKSEYIPEPDPENPLPQTPVCYKLVVYTAEAFNKTINFTHPFYLPENDGILKLEIYFDNGEEPTLVMQPREIIPRSVTSTEMQIREKPPIYDINDPAIGFKMLAIMLSGWGAMGSGDD